MQVQILLTYPYHGENFSFRSIVFQLLEDNKEHVDWDTVRSISVPTRADLQEMDAKRERWDSTLRSEKA